MTAGLSLAAPAGLWFLATIPVIVWLHLRRRRARPAVVPSIMPWLALQAVPPPARRRLPRTLLLILRCLVAAAVALALAQPQLPGTTPGAEGRAVVLDVSSSMAAADTWPAAVAVARELIAATRGEVTLVTLGPRPRVLVARDPGGGRALAALAGLRPGGTGAAVGEALALAAAAAGPAAEVVVVSDGQAAAASAGGARWEMVGRPADNVAIVTAAPGTAGAETRLFARVAAFTTGPAAVPLVLSVDGAPWDRRVVQLAAGGTDEVVWSLPADARRAELRLESPDALAADNSVVVPLQVPERRIQLVGESPAVARALGALGGTVVEPAGLATFRADGSADVTAFVGELPAVLPPGGVLVFRPHGGGALDVTTGVATAAVVTVGDHPLVAGLDLSGVTLADVAAVAPAVDLEPVLTVDDRAVALAGRRGESRLVAWLFDPDAGDVAHRLAFPLWVARAVDAVAPALAATPVPAGAAVDLPPGPQYTVTRPDGHRQVARGRFDDTAQPGLYRAEARPPGNRLVEFSVQAGDLRESDLRLPGEVPQPVATAATAVAPLPLWPWLAAVGLALLLLEAAVRAANRPAAARGGGS